MGGSEDGVRWAEWLGERVATRGAGGKMSQAALHEALKKAGHKSDGSTISRWLKGSRPGTAELAAAVGEILNDRSGALLAAGYADQTLGNFRRSGNPATRETIVIGPTSEQWERIKHLTVEEMAALGEGIIVVIDRD